MNQAPAPVFFNKTNQQTDRHCQDKCGKKGKLTGRNVFNRKHSSEGTRHRLSQELQDTSYIFDLSSTSLITEQ